MKLIRTHRLTPSVQLLAGCLLLALSPTALIAGSSDETHSVEVVPRLETYAEIDAALDEAIVQPLGGEWRYLPGTEAPSPAKEWTEEAFDESSWASGPAPFTFGVETAGTTVHEFGDGVTSVYLRGVLKLEELNRYERIVMELPVEGGFLFYLNGDTTKRMGSGDPKVEPTFEAVASRQRLATALPVPTADLTRTVHSGINQLAIHGLLNPGEPASFGIFPTIRGTFQRSPEFDKARRQTLYDWIQSAEDDGRVARLAYLEGRYAQRSGAVEDAIAHFTNALARDPSSARLWSRRIECQRTLGTLSTFDTECRASFGPDTTAQMLDAWTHVSLDELHRSPIDIAAAIPGDLVLRPGSLISDTVWIASRLSNGEAIRLDSGRDRDRDVQDSGWSRDRFYSPATYTRTTLSDGTTPRTWGAGRSVRVSARAPGDLTPTYRVPLPQGAYELRLSFVGNDGEECALGAAKFDVMLEGSVLLEDYDPVLQAGLRGRAVHSFPIHISDGFLDLDLLPQTQLTPWIAGIEIHPLSAEAYREHAEAWVATLDAPRAYPLVQLAEARWMSGDAHGSLAAFEQAEALPGFQTTQAERLSRLRMELLPEVASFASADDLVRNHRAEVQTWLATIQAAAADQALFATYLEGRLHQYAGHTEEALGIFEGLVAGHTGVLAPLHRMAECLVAAGLADHAVDLLSEGLAGAGPLPPELLTLWISLNLEVLNRDPWSVIGDLESMGAPERLVVVPTSEDVPQSWRISVVEPPSTSWSRPTYDPSSWQATVGALGTGHSPHVKVRGSWSTDSLYARTDFKLDSTAMLYPHVSVYARDAVNVYLNGSSVGFVAVDTGGYVDLPTRKGSWSKGANVLGMHAFNSSDAGSVDVGIVQPLGDLMWVARSLESDGALRLNCGGPQVTTADGTVWSKDRFFGWAKPLTYPDDQPRLEIHETDDDVLYESMRFFYSNVISTWYQIPLPNGDYRIRLHFAEIESAKVEGDRVFQVALEDYVILEDHDILACAGPNTADIHWVDMPVSDGWLDLRILDPDSIGVISALEITPIKE